MDATVASTPLFYDTLTVIVFLRGFVLLLTLPEICKKYKVTKNRCTKAIQRGYLLGNKSSGRWFVEEKDAEKYFSEPKPPDWIPLQLACELIRMPENFLKNMAEEGKIQSKKYRNKWYICVATIKNLTKKRSAKEKLKKISGSFVVKNEKGLHCRPSTEISKLFIKHNILKFSIKVRDIEYVNPGLLDFLMLEIKKGEKVSYTAFAGEDTLKFFNKEFKLLVKNNFYMNY